MLFFAVNLPLLVLLIAPFNNFHLVVSSRCGMCCVQNVMPGNKLRM